jgi:ferric-dicitrate binding protein FerR (iron transport regulator)
MEKNRSHASPEPSGQDDLASLLQLAGRRPNLPEARVAPIRAAAREAFRRQARRTASRRRLAWMAGAGLAAGLLLVAGLTFLDPVRSGSRLPVATFEMRTGDVVVTGGGPEAREVSAGSVITTGQGGRAALRLPAGASLRIDAGTSLRFDSPRALTLERGTVYVDSGASPQGGRGLEVVTALGSVRDVGTQFEARLLPADTLRVRVREGTILLARGGEVHQAGAGGELIVEAGGGLRRAAVPVSGPGWEWVQRTAPALAIEGVSLARFLDWVSRETGLRWRLAEPGAGQPPEEIILHGSIAGLTPEEALAVVLPGCGYRHRIEGESLWLESPGGR